MKPLTEIMQLIDTHSDVIPEGDYLRVCGLLKNVYDQMSKPSKKVVRAQQCVQMSPPLRERYRLNCTMRYKNRLATKKASMDLRGLKIRSRITEAVKVEAGSDDRGTCKKYLRDKNLEVLRIRVTLEAKLVELESEKESLEVFQRVIMREWEDEIASWSLNNPGIEAIRLL